MYCNFLQQQPKPITMSQATPNHDELCRLISTTLHSLVDDAAAVRQLSSMQRGIENMNPQNATSLKSLRELRELEKAMAAIETKVEALRAIVTEEKRALDTFDTTLQKEANAQKAVLDHMIESCRRPPPRQKMLKPAAHREKNGGQTATATTPAQAQSHTATPNRRRDSVDPRAQLHKENPFQAPVEESQFTFEPVTESEWVGISRTIRANRVNLLTLNEALEEIETVCRHKFSVLSKISQSTFTGAAPTTQSLGRRYEYLRQQRANVELEVSAHSGHQWVSEQELREACAFFRLGESTARASLTMLCSLKRLKQVPSKKGGVTYICLWSK
jgi:hypothetical protein